MGGKAAVYAKEICAYCLKYGRVNPATLSLAVA
jgi:hypothetical protein